MAQKISPQLVPVQPAQQAQPEEQQNELEILNPEREIELNGKVYTVREYGHLEWLKLLYKVEPLVQLVYERIDTQCIERFSTEDVLLLVSEHFDVMMPIITQATDMTLQELDALEFEEIQVLIATWWNINGPFFINRALARWIVKMQDVQNMAAAQQVLAKSTPHSSQGDTGLQTSGATPGDS